MTMDAPTTGASDTGKRKYHIFGNGISFSISPTIHNAGFSHYSLPYTYDIRQSPSIDDVAHLIAAPQFGGASVTMPHKLYAHKFCDEQSDAARKIGSVNTLVVQGPTKERRRTIRGENTDWSGLHAIIVEYLDSDRASSASSTRFPSEMTGLVIGAGGASRAALYALHCAGLGRILLANRTLSVAEKVRSDFGDIFTITICPSFQSPEDIPSMPDVIIGTIPAETTTEEQFAGLFRKGSGGLCIDMSYKPRRTPLLETAKKHKGWKTVTGVDVLVAQAYDQFRLWTGRDPPVEAMIDAVRRRDEEMEDGTVSCSGKI